MCAEYPGRSLPDEDARTDALIRLWDEPIPGGWQRGPHPRILTRGRRYTRGNVAPAAHRRGEHIIEHEILAPFAPTPDVRCLGAEVLDGVNAVPLTTDAGGGRAGNVEADMLLLTAAAGERRLVLVEVKDAGDTAWYATVELLRQLRLFLRSPESQRVFHRRLPDLDLEHPLAVTGIVLAPPSYYSAPGKKGASVGPARRLVERARSALGVDVRLTTWLPEQRTIEELDDAVVARMSSPFPRH